MYRWKGTKMLLTDPYLMPAESTTAELGVGTNQPSIDQALMSEAPIE